VTSAADASIGSTDEFSIRPRRSAVQLAGHLTRMVVQRFSILTNPSVSRMSPHQGGPRMASPLARRAPPVTCAASCSQRARTLAPEEGRSIDRHPPGASATRTDRERRTFVPRQAGGTHIDVPALIGHGFRDVQIDRSRVLRVNDPTGRPTLCVRWVVGAETTGSPNLPLPWLCEGERGSLVRCSPTADSRRWLCASSTRRCGARARLAREVVLRHPPHADPDGSSPPAGCADPPTRRSPGQRVTPLTRVLLRARTSRTPKAVRSVASGRQIDHLITPAWPDRRRCGLRPSTRPGSSPTQETAS
jgi:hypothetical protein